MEIPSNNILEILENWHTNGPRWIEEAGGLDGFIASHAESLVPAVWSMSKVKPADISAAQRSGYEAFAWDMATSKHRKILMAIARNRYTPVALLHVLATDPQEDVRSCVAANCSTPDDVLAVLSDDPEGWVRKGLTFNRRMQAPLWRAKNFVLSDEELLLLAQHPIWWVREALAARTDMHAEIAPKVLRVLAADRNLYVSWAAIGNPQMPVDILEYWGQRFIKYAQEQVDFDENVDADVAFWHTASVVKNPRAPAALLHALLCALPQTLSQNNQETICDNIAIHPNTAAETLLYILETRKHPHALRAASHPNLPLHVLEELEKRPPNGAPEYEGVRRCLAGNPNLSVEMFQRLAKDEDEFVRGYVAANSAAPPDVLEILADDTSEEVRANLASNPKSTEKILQFLVEREDKYVRADVAQNANASPNVLRILSADEDEWVRIYVASNPNTSLEVLQVLAADESASVRMQVASNPNLPIHVLQTMALGTDPYARSVVASNPNFLRAVSEGVPECVKLFDVLVQDENEGLRAWVAESKYAPTAIRAVLLEQEDVQVWLKQAYKER